MPDQPHPYFPPDAAVPGYTPNETPLLLILASFGGLIGVFVFGSVTLAKWYSPKLKRADQLVVAWFALCMSFPFIGLSRNLNCSLVNDRYTLILRLLVLLEGSKLTN